MPTDSWGFYNNDASSEAPNSNSARGILNKVYMPGGGFQEFIYEPHYDGANNIIAGGMRVKEIHVSDGQNTHVKKINYESIRYRAPYDTATYTFHQPYWDKDPPGTGMFSCDCDLFVKKYPLKHNLNYTGGSYVSYGKVTEYTGSNGEGGKIVYYFNNTPDTYDYSLDYPGAFSGLEYPFVPATSMEWKRGLPDSVVVYRKSDSGSYIKIEQTENTYSELDSSFTEGLVVGKNNLFPSGMEDYKYKKYRIKSRPVILEESVSYNYNIDGSNPMNTSNKLEYNENLLVSQKSSESDGKLYITKYFYPGDYQNISSPVNHVSLLKTLKIKNAPVEVISGVYNNYAPGQPLVTDSLKILSGVINVYNDKGLVAEVWELETPEGNPISITDFKPSNMAGNGYWDGSIDTFSIDTRYYKKQIEYKYNELGQVIESTKHNITNSVLYGKNNTPIASIVNAPANEVFYTSFENKDCGDWDIYENTIYPAHDVNDSIHAKSGEYVALLYGSISFRKQLEKNYVLSFYAKRLQTINLPDHTGTPGPPVIDINGELIDVISDRWEKYQINLNASPASPMAEVTISSSMRYLIIDEIRLYPASALMSTKTYGSSGLISETDADGITTYYRYDNLDRLKYIMDNDYNIVKTMEYHYK